MKSEAYILSACLPGSETHSIGNHSPPHLGTKIESYISTNQLQIERVCESLSFARNPKFTKLICVLKLELPFNLIQVLALGLVKLSILFFYRRVFRGRAFNIANWVLIGTVTAWATTFFIAIVAGCGTSIAARFQTLGALKKECVNTFAIEVALAVTDVAVDLVMLIMPIPLVRCIS